jgi:uncharacterized protein YkwD
MTRRWTGRHTLVAASATSIVFAVVGSYLLFAGAEPPRSQVAGTRIMRSVTGARDPGAVPALAHRRMGSQNDNEAPAPQPSVAETLSFFRTLLYGPPPPSIADTLVFFHALLYAPGAPPSPSVAETLVFFHALLYGSSNDTPQPPAPEPRPVARAPQPAPTPTPLPPLEATADPGVWTDASFTHAVWDGVNQRRAQAGLGAVSQEPRMYVAARDYAVLSAERRWFSHTGPDGSSFVDRLVAAGFPFTVTVGEVLAMGSHGWPSDGVVQAWIDSPPHREQLLNPEYTRAGLECAFSHENGALMVRCVMEFAAS